MSWYCSDRAWFLGLLIMQLSSKMPPKVTSHITLEGVDDFDVLDQGVYRGYTVAALSLRMACVLFNLYASFDVVELLPELSYLDLGRLFVYLAECKKSFLK